MTIWAPHPRHACIATLLIHLDIRQNLAHYWGMTHSSVTLDRLTALFSEHFMGDCTNAGNWRIIPRGLVGAKHCRWFDDHAKDNLRKQFWSAGRNALVCADETEATCILMALESEYIAWSET